MGGPCEYASYEGRCSLANVRGEKNANDDELTWLTVTYRGTTDPSIEFSETFSLPSREVPYAQRYYRRFDDVACKGQRIKHGTCNPQSGGFSTPRFRFPGSPHERPGGCEQPLACEDQCKDQKRASCERGGYGAFFGVETVPDRPRAMLMYRSSLKLAVKECKDGDKSACIAGATLLELELVGDLPAEDRRAALGELYAKACSLGDSWGCSSAQGQQASPP